MGEPVAELGRLLAPEAIAVIGSARECGRVVEQNRALGFAGALWPVHPSRATVAGERAYRRVADLPGIPDAAFVAVPAAATSALCRSAPCSPVSAKPEL